MPVASRGMNVDFASFLCCKSLKVIIDSSIRLDSDFVSCKILLDAFDFLCINVKIATLFDWIEDEIREEDWIE